MASAQSQATGSQTESRVAELIKRELLLERAHLWRSAIDVNVEVLRLDPKNAAAMNTLAGLYGTLGEFEEEVIWARKALDIDPRFELAYTNYGNGLAALGRFQEAQAAFERANELVPMDPLPLYSLGVLAESQGKIEQALSFYERSVVLDGRFENGYFNMAAMLANLKRFDEAIAALKKLLELNPETPNAKQMLQQIEEERASSADSAKINCREVQEPVGQVLECPAFDLIVSLAQPLPLATLSDVLSAGGLATTESGLMVGGSRHPALRIEKQRSDGGTQIGWATIVVVNGVERNVTCYLHPPHTEEKACAEGLSQLSSGQLRLKVN